MSNSTSNAAKGWLNFLNPQTLRTNLISASTYLVAWETFENSVIDELAGFYTVGFEAETGTTFSREYEAAVLSRDKSRFRASMLWLKENGVIDDADLELADWARLHRNQIAHNLPAFVARTSHIVDVGLLNDLCALLHRIDVWWIRNIHIPTNGEFDDRDVDAIPDSEITSGNILFLTLMLKTAMGDETEASKFYEEFARRMGASKSANM